MLLAIHTVREKTEATSLDQRSQCNNCTNMSKNRDITRSEVTVQ